MSIPVWLRWSVLVVAVALLITRAVDLTAGAADYEIAQKPLYTGSSEPPLMLMVMSRDERLFTKAFSDYTDLNDDGVLDTTYLDTFTYEGYFDPKLCYAYSSAQFKAAAQASGANGHSCSGQWSGNFLNWVTMSRLDILRYVLYGGRRITDTATQTVLERAHIPNDLHAWVKVYSGADIGSFTPLTGAHSFCNSSHGNGPTDPPVMRYAGGNWSEWAATALNQCRVNYNSDTPTAATDRNVRVEVCDPSAPADQRESFCARYGSSNYKPTGLLQSYGESNRLRFGLISGSYSNPRDGGILRRNIGRFAGNDAGCVAGNEVDLATGIFCNQGSGVEGIVNTLNRFKLTQWNGWTADSKWADCNDWGILNRQGQGRPRSLNNPGTGADNCSAWGNPLAEMYAEALRYVAGETAATGPFTAGTDLTGLPAPAWLDPYRPAAQGGNSYCASCNILVMTSGLPSFDSDEIPTVPHVGDAAAATDAVGGNEGIAGNYLVGRLGATPKGTSINTHEDICSAKNVSNLSLVRGICPDIPSLEGSYLVSGLAYKANTTDLRPGLQGKPADHLNTVTTYAVALADNLPKFDIPLADGKITLAPLCQAHASGSAQIADAGWRTCFLGSVGVGPKTSTVSPSHVYGRQLQYDGNGRAVAGSFSLVWEDSLWGNDHDNDVVSMLTYCVGSACDANTNPNNTDFTGKDICWRATDSPACNPEQSPSVADNEVLVRVENLSAYAGNGMLTGFAVTGSDADGVHRLARRPGGSDNSILTNQADPPGTWDAPKVLKFTIGTSDAKSLESPLWYAAKYGGFKDVNKNGVPDVGEWDSRQSGAPDNYFFARDPSKLKAELERIFRAATIDDNTTAGGGAGARIGDASFTIEVGYRPGPQDNETDWVGYLRGRQVTALGGEGDLLWDAGSKMPAPADRNIFVVTRLTEVDAAGAVTEAASAAEFQGGNLPGTNNAERLAALGMPNLVPTWLGATPSVDTLVGYLRGETVPGYRQRSSLLGDIINSQPEIVTPLDDFGYAHWTYSPPSAPAWKAGLGNGYKEYLSEKRSNSKPMVYVGANDGMLHAFDASRDAGGGDEVFAFIPAGSRKHLYELANPDYDHRYFVDGLITVSDVSFSSSGSGDWRTVLVGSTGAGGAGIAAGATTRGHGSVFALDVSDAGGFDADSVLWELGGTNDDDFGFVLGKPLIVPVKGSGGAPRWVAMFGNGPNSVNGLPVLYVVDIETGAVLAKLKPGTDYAGRNGLMNIAPVAVTNSDGLVDTVYSGDLLGNLWKFDLSSDDTSGWNIAYSGAPMFSAVHGGIPQPITGGIEVSSGPGGGISIFFGTGSYFAEGDGASLAVQSLYGLWDDLGTSPINGRDALVGQNMQALTTSNGYQTRGVGPSPPTAVNYALHRGWYVDLAVAGNGLGERFMGTPRLQNGKVIFTTYEPSDVICSAGGGDNWLYVLDLLNGTGGMGGVTLTPGGDAVCTGNCGAVSLNKEDDPSAPVKSTNVFVPKLTPCDPADPSCTVDQLISAEQCSFVLRAAGANPLYMPRPCGRQSWRQVR